MRKLDAEERVNRRNRRTGEFIQALTEGRGAQGLQEGKVTGISVRLPTDESPEAFLVVKATGQDGDKVGFVGGLDLVQAILVWAAKDARGGLKWRKDVPYDQR